MLQIPLTIIIAQAQCAYQYKNNLPDAYSMFLNGRYYLIFKCLALSKVALFPSATRRKRPSTTALLTELDWILQREK